MSLNNHLQSGTKLSASVVSRIYLFFLPVFPPIPIHLMPPGIWMIIPIFFTIRMSILTIFLFPTLARASAFFQDRFLTQAASDSGRLLPFHFALNWYAGKDQVLGYHIVNVSLHILCAWILFFLLQSLFKTPNLSDCCKGDEQEYRSAGRRSLGHSPDSNPGSHLIVQRMTLLATLFYLSGLLCYIHGRIHTEKTDDIWSVFRMFLCLLLAMGSKENAVIFPLSLALIEIVFFKNLSEGTHLKTSFRHHHCCDSQLQGFFPLCWPIPQCQILWHSSTGYRQSVHLP